MNHPESIFKGNVFRPSNRDSSRSDPLPGVTWSKRSRDVPDYIVQTLQLW